MTEQMLREAVHVDAVQCGFPVGKYQTEAIFMIITRRVHEHTEIGKDLFHAYVDLMKAGWESNKCNWPG